MSTFSIKDIELLTGIKSHTIRIWEQRYGLIEPARTDTNIRYYSEHDLRALLNINILYKAGHKISKIAGLSRAELENSVIAISTSTISPDLQLQAMISAMLRVDEAAFQKILLTAMQNIGVVGTMEQLVFPLMKHIGLLWQAGTIDPAFEHFISYIIRHRLISATDAVIPSEAIHQKKFLLFLPENEPHEIGLLLANYMIRKAGHGSLYLGADMPHQAILKVVNSYKPDYIFCSAITGNLPSTPAEIMNFLSDNYPATNLLLTGGAFLAAELELNSNCQVITCPQDLQNILDL